MKKIVRKVSQEKLLLKCEDNYIGQLSWEGWRLGESCVMNLGESTLVARLINGRKKIVFIV